MAVMIQERIYDDGIIKMADRLYTIPLRDAYEGSRFNRARKAIRIVKEYLARHTKSDNVRLDPSINQDLWVRGIKKPPRRVKVKVMDEDGKLTATLAE